VGRVQFDDRVGGSHWPELRTPFLPFPVKNIP
jgi:hypothetical protein